MKFRQGCGAWFNFDVPSTSRSTDKRERLRERRAARRGELLTAAMEVIRRDGADATMEEMATAGGISKPILYRHFNDRDGLVSAITELALAELARLLEEKVGEARLAGSRAGIRGTIDAFFQYIDSDPELYRFIVDQDSRLSDSATVAFTEEVGKHVSGAIREALTDAGRSADPAEVWGRAIVGMVTMTSRWWIANPSVPRATVVDYLADLAWTGISGTHLPGDPPHGHRDHA
ncbi:TetR/AcrR family transcriptional regulator [Desertimonas flava]|jgi:AcrR family transcriptional regulator|uniref:TetR/AcrR family transcriptional regulator n=1 Tax=Desertimonas flava TaxID=2064846 RepID=UPI0013C4B4FD|nr:TetR family transcriptional regulator [Desertimonas flava]